MRYLFAVPVETEDVRKDPHGTYGIAERIAPTTRAALRNFLLPLSFGCCGFVAVVVGGAEGRGATGTGLGAGGAAGGAARVAIVQIE